MHFYFLVETSFMKSCFSPPIETAKIKYILKISDVFNMNAKKLGLLLTVFFFANNASSADALQGKLPLLKFHPLQYSSPMDESASSERFPSTDGKPTINFGSSAIQSFRLPMRLDADAPLKRFNINDEKPLIHFDLSGPKSVPTGNPTIDNYNLRSLKECIKILGSANCKHN